VGRTEALAGSRPVTFHPMDEIAARAIATWRYEVPYEVYSLDAEDADQLVRCFLDPVNAYHTIVDNGACPVAYCCFGPDAQVPGGDYDNPALDVGLGVRPDLTGQGLGHAFVRAVLRFARQEFAPTEYRVTVAEFNERALRVWKTAGFQSVQRFERVPDGMPFLVLTMRNE
jgi:ribosomal-protein-alanine N-acetyltransferase